MLTKLCDAAAVKLFEDGPGGFAGYGSTFGNFDRAKEAVTPGAFAKTLPAFLKDGFIAVGHDWHRMPVATVKDAREDATGLYLEAEFHGTTEAQAARQVVRERLERGKSVGLSIGYNVGDYEDTEGGRLLKEIELHEVSLVTVPCNPLAQVAGVKGSLAGLTFADHADAVLSELEEFVERAKQVSDLRAKEGRVLSGRHRLRVEQIRDHAVALLEAATREPKAADDGLAVFAEVQRTLARLSGAGV